MGRLIDEDVLMDKLVELLQIYVKNPYAQGIIIGNIANLPTAYDVDKVVAELEENKKTATNCSSIFDTQAYVRLDKAVEIVRKGGVKNE